MEILRKLSVKAFLALSVMCGATTAVHAENLTQYVNPYVGTGGHGHVFLGANVPFGYIQLGPTEKTRGWDWCSGYHYSDNVLIGFGHTHLSGTGIGDLGDIALLPVSTAAQDSVIFAHSDETVRPGYYGLKLNNPNVKVELTATQRVGMHRYTFANAKKALMKLDLLQGIGWDTMKVCGMRQVSPTLITGYRKSTGWAKNQQVYFAAEFSTPVKMVQGNDTIAVLELADATRPVLVKVGLSAVNEGNAMLNMQAEVQGCRQGLEHRAGQNQD